VVLRRFCTLQALLAWHGGFLFYAAVVVPIGTDVLGSFAALAVLAWDVSATPPYRLGRWLTWVLMAACLAALFYLHAVLDANFDPARKTAADPTAFRFAHGAYLWVSTMLWLAGLVFACLTVKAWSSPPLERVAG
jgi:hypothetical protein